MPSEKPSVADPSHHTLASKEIPLTDRMEEMQLLREGADRAANGRGAVIFLCGEAGIGKTRLAKELKGYARAKGMQVLSGRCPALLRIDGFPPYVLWEEVIKDYLEVCTPEQLFRVIGSYPIEVSKLVPGLQQKLGAFPQSFPLSPDRSRHRLFEAVTQLITNISVEAPLLIILDDLQWTDQSSLLLLHYLAREVNKEAILILGAYRDTYVDRKHPLFPVLTELNRERLLQSVPLKRMSFDDVSEMTTRILEQGEVSDEFRKLVYEKTRGNPFFVEEVIKSMKEEGTIHREKNRWKISRISKIEFPETVKDVIKARIGRLDDECQHVLTIASFIGKDFAFDALREASGLAEERLLEKLDKLLKAGLLKARVIHGVELCSFGDVIVRDVVQQEVNPLRARRLHGAVGSALEEVYGRKVDEHLGELAHHFLESGNKEKALRYFFEAGEKAASVYANREAASCYQSALTLIDGNGQSLQQRANVLEKLGDIKAIVGEYEASMKLWNEALDAWKKLPEKRNMARLNRKMANLLWEEIGDKEKAEAHHNKALRILETEPGSIELASLYEDIAHMHHIAGNVREALPRAEQALKLAKNLKTPEVIASSASTLGAIFESSGNREVALKYLEEALQIALKNDYWETATRTYNWLSTMVEEDEMRLKYLEEAHKLARRVGCIDIMSYFQSAIAMINLNAGDTKEALRLAENSASLDRKTRNLTNLSGSTAILALAYDRMGETKKAEKLYREALKTSEKQTNYLFIAGSHQDIGIFYLTKGEPARAKEYLERANEIFDKAGDKRNKTWNSLMISLAHLELGEIEEAKKLIAEARRHSLASKDRWQIAFVDAHRAMLSRAQKRWKEAITGFEKSLQEFEALDARRWNVYWLAKLVLYEYARVYSERAQEGDNQKARNLLNEALKLFQRIGAKKEISRTEAMLTFVGTGRIVKPRPVKELDLPSHVKTGYGELDDLLFGGIPRNYAVVLASDSCDERNLLVERFLKTGLQEGEVTFHMTAKAGAAETVEQDSDSNLCLFVCNPQAEKLIKDRPNVFRLKGVENLTDISLALTGALRNLDKSPIKPRRICIEIVSDVLLQHHAVQSRRWLNALIPELKSKGFTTLAVMDPGMHSPQETRAVLDIFEGQIDVYEKDTINGVEKFLKIRKMTNQEYLESELPLRKDRLRCR